MIRATRPRAYAKDRISTSGEFDLSNFFTGWTATHHEEDKPSVPATHDMTDQVLRWLGDVAPSAVVHAAGFMTPSVNPMTINPALSWPASKTYNWSGLDLRFGYPTQANGWYKYMQPYGELVLTACGCPPWMRVDPRTLTGAARNGLPPDAAAYNPAGAWTASVPGPVPGESSPWKRLTPTSSELTSLAEYQPPWHEYNVHFADFIVKVLQRYPHVKYVQVWNELKNFWNKVDLRWWYEGYTNLYNAVWDAVKDPANGVSDRKVIGPYPVFGWNGWSERSKWTSYAQAPELFPGGLARFGYPLTQVLDVFKYWNVYCKGADYVSLDIRNSVNDFERADFVLTAMCSTTAGSPIIDSPEGPIQVLPRRFNDGAFPGGDVNKFIAGPGIPAGAKIISVQSTTRLTMNVNATATTAPGVYVPLSYGENLTKTITDATIGNTGSGASMRGTVQSATAAFVASDIGSYITGPGIPLGATISDRMDVGGGDLTKKVKLNIAVTPPVPATNQRVTYGNWPWETSYYWPPGEDPWSLHDKAHAMVAWLRAQTATNVYTGQPGPLSSAPLWVNEWYANSHKNFDLMGTGNPAEKSSDEEKLSGIAWGIIEYTKAGFHGLMMWRYISEGTNTYANPLAVFVEDPKPSVTTILHPFLKFHNDNFKPAAILVDCSVTDPEINVLATPKHAIVVSKSSSSKKIMLDNKVVSLSPYGVAMITR